MENWKKFYLFILSLLVFSQGLLAEEHITGATPVANDRLTTHLISLFPAKTNLFSQPAEITIDDARVDFEPHYDYSFRKTVLKYKKKIKRAYTFSTRLKHPVKEIDIVAINIFTKESYSKPFFLSHLHHFLFRLTPF